MIISEATARQVVEQLSSVIDQHINIMDVTGTIVGSTDPMRIGTIHGGAKRILAENLKTLVIESNEEYEGAKSGINLPVLFDGEIVGVIGITGNGEEVKKYGEIIKKMTEILLLDSYAQERRTIEQKARDRFFDEWIFNAFDKKDPAGFTRRAEQLGIQPQLIRRVAILSVAGGGNEPLSDIELTEISRDIRRLLSKTPHTEMFRTATGFICLFDKKTNEQITDILSEVISSVTAKHACIIIAGVDSGAATAHISGSHEQAERALSAGRGKRASISVYDELDPVQFACGISEKDKRRFISNLFGNATHEETIEWIGLLKVFYKFDGSIQKTAFSLNMHKNTVQYKLNKLTELSGHDPRSYYGAFLFLFAIELSAYLENEV